MSTSIKPPKSVCEALSQTLLLALTASTEKNSRRAAKRAEEFARCCTPSQIKRAKSTALAKAYLKSELTALRKYIKTTRQ